MCGVLLAGLTILKANNMAQYISKSALVAEIESKIEKYTKRGEESDAKRDGYGMYWGGVLSCLNEVRTLCNTIEVKEVDLDEEFDRYCDNLYLIDLENEPYAELFDVAKHFFELGIQVSNKAQKGEKV